MARETNMNLSGAGAKNYTGTADWGVNIVNRGNSLAGKIRKEWNIGGGSSGKDELSFNAGRNPDSEDHIYCEDWQGMIIIAGQEVGQAQTRLDQCGAWKTKCKRRAKIDKVKWRNILDYAESMTVAQSTGKYNTCVEVDQQAEIDMVLAAQEGYLESKEPKGLGNGAIMGLIAAGTIGSIFIILKVVK